MDFTVYQPEPTPVIIEQPQPPVIINSPPPAVIIEQPPPPFIVQHQPQTMIIEQPPPPVLVQTVAPTPVIMPTIVHPCMESTPVATTCKFCKQSIVTVTRPINGTFTWMLAGGLFLFCLWPCCLIPFYVKACKDIEHSCPNCKNVLDVYKRM